MKIARSVSDGIFRHQLEGFDGYPKNRDSRFLEVFNEVCISVDHARAVAEAFELKMPTIQDIRDTARNLRPKFELTLSQREEWERKYGPPKPFDITDLSRVGTNREIDRLWQQVMGFLRTTKFDGMGDIQRVPIGRCWQIAKHFGYPMNTYQQREIDDYERAVPQSRQNLPKIQKPITQDDFDALKRVQ